MSGWLSIDAVTLLRAVQARILDEPESFDMEWWYQEGSRWIAPLDILAFAEQSAQEGQIVLPCGAAACIAGDLCLLDNPQRLAEAIRGDTWEEFNALMANEASARLGLSPRVARGLFECARWPFVHSAEYGEAQEEGDAPRAAAAAVAAIDSFINSPELFDMSDWGPWAPSYDDDDDDGGLYDYDDDDDGGLYDYDYDDDWGDILLP